MPLSKKRNREGIAWELKPKLNADIYDMYEVADELIAVSQAQGLSRLLDMAHFHLGRCKEGATKNA